MNEYDISVLHGRERSGFSWLPGNVANYFNENYCTIEISVCNTDAECGYGYRINKCFRILRPYCKCNNCSYHSLWNPDDSDSKCKRHTYTKGWDCVFSYSLDGAEDKISLDEAFDLFLQRQSKLAYEPIKELHI